MTLRHFISAVCLLVGSLPAWSREASLKAIVGTGKAGYSGDGGSALKAEINNPFGLVRGPDGALYFCDVGNHLIRKVDRQGLISTVVGTGKAGWSGDGGPALKAELNEPYEVRFDKVGNLWWVERLSHTVRKMDAKSGTVSTVAGNGQPGFAGDDGPGSKAQLNQPHSLQFTADGTLLVCDILNHRVRQIDPTTGVISTIAGTGKKGPIPANGAPLKGTALSGPRALDLGPDGTVWLALREGNALLRLDLKSSTMTHIAGTGKSGFTGNGGPALEATLSGPKGVSLSSDGQKIYLCDTESHSIRFVDLAVSPPRLELLVGDGKKGLLARPHGVFVDADGQVLIGDSENHRIWSVKP